MEKKEKVCEGKKGGKERKFMGERTDPLDFRTLILRF